MNEFNLQAIDDTFTRFKVGAKVMAEVVYIMKDGVLLNIGGKKDGFIPYGVEDDTIADLKVGDKFEAVITATKDDTGFIILSKKRADDIRIASEIISNLKVGDTTSLIITASNKYGLLSRLGTFEVFIPFSQISARNVDKNLENYVNKQFNAVVLEIDLVGSKIVASIRAFEENERITKENAFWGAIFENKVVKGKVVRFTDFGVFVNVDGVDCLLHNSEVSYDKSVKASDILSLDEEYEFKVIALDRENKKVSLSLKALTKNPLIDKLATLKVGDVVNGEVKKILPFGAVIVFNGDIEGMLHVKEASHFYVKNIYEVAKVGQKLDLKIIDIDLDNCKVGLSLKAMQPEPEVVKLAKERGAAIPAGDKEEILYSTDNPKEE